ncbi:hypothetical protein [Patulibacter minatonensis]|uniref:hypothetical protein n=1 Tax=Patulibacter minatonensis TaxID=298163 RepID=UPI000479D506|nr:hypothetical protein [Patulibacter minatonensis]
MRRTLVSVLATAAVLCGAGASSASAASWTNVPLPPPPGGAFSVPAGFVGDIAFWAPNRGLMTVGGNNSVKPGLYSWDGESWHQLSTVCGGGPNAKIAWAGPDEFWTITGPSVGTLPNGLGVCHYRGGAVVGSYSFYNVPDFVPQVNAATCRTASDCWFGGVGATSVGGNRVGAFHLHWDGTTLSSVYNGQGRGVSDLITHRGQVLESTYVGTGPGAQGTRPFLNAPEPVPALLHRIDGLSFTNAPFTPAPMDGVPTDGTDLRSLDTDGTTAWAVGGGANSGPSAADGFVPRTPIAVRKDGDGAWQELPLQGDLPTAKWFGSVAALPETRAAWATLADTEVAGATPSGETSAPSVAFVGADGQVSTERLDDREGGAARGAATAIACPTSDDCWVATARGYLYRRTSGATYARDTDPAFQGTITIRPNEAASQVIPDEPPADDSRLLAPPVVLAPPVAPVPPECDAPPALVSRVKAGRKALTARQKRQQNAKITLVIRFKLARRAKVGVIAKRGRKTVGRAKAKTFRPGTRSLEVAVRRKSFPKKISFTLKELTTPACVTGGGDDDSVVSTRADHGSTVGVPGGASR